MMSGILMGQIDDLPLWFAGFMVLAWGIFLVACLWRIFNG